MGNPTQLELLTVDTMVGQRSLGGLAGDINDGSWDSPSYHALGHNLKF